ncbi:MAG TPA: NUDIX domain-containing protein [Steroidobacteraceae bacterium]|nr:NUDIX domain-containing protein [Dehalococcoidia bacterium]HYM26833.1 NUDIX domain-containing protein [Steroidobacteraceae bacterium]
MSILSHNVYDNVRTRVIVPHAGALLLVVEFEDGRALWHPPGGGMEPHESLAECAAREVMEETGIAVEVGRVAFLREWVVPAHCALPEAGDGYGYGMEVFMWARPRDAAAITPCGELEARWVPLGDVPALPLWPNELKSLAARIAADDAPAGAHAFVSQLDDPALPARGVDW